MSACFFLLFSQPLAKDTLSPLGSRHQGGEGFTKTCAVHLEALLDFPADHSASRVLGKAVLAEMAWLVGEGMVRREARKGSHLSVFYPCVCLGLQEEVRGA